ncbi:hypothetical protein EI555_016274, partial [Monodon monoceros]
GRRVATPRPGPGKKVSKRRCSALIGRGRRGPVARQPMGGAGRGRGRGRGGGRAGGRGGGGWRPGAQRPQPLQSPSRFLTAGAGHHETRRVIFSPVFTMEDSGKTFSSEEEEANYWKNLAMTYKQ